MSGALPNVRFNALNFKNNQKTLFSETDSGKSFRRQVQGQRFSFTVSYPPMKRSEFAPIMAFIIKQRSRKENFVCEWGTLCKRYHYCYRWFCK